ncbi:MAG: hypothetical protein II319_05135 [Clostridia bacterium]|nr:hypothetical protein [Clostridia bacterium]
MADYKLVNTTKLDAGMTATADKIRAGTGKTDKITWKEENGFADDIPEGVEQATPSIDVDSEGKITASSTQGAGIVKSGTHESTKQLESQAAKTVTPGTSDQIAVNKGKYTTGDVTVKGDPDLIPGNILKGVEIFDVIGTVEKGIAIEKGSFIPETDVSEVTIKHNLGVEPSLALFYPFVGFDNFTLHYTVFGIYILNNNINEVWHSNGPAGLGAGGWLTYKKSATEITFSASSLEYRFKAGSEYKYILLGGLE